MLSVHQVGQLSGKALSKSSSQQHLDSQVTYNSVANRHLGSFNPLDLSKPTLGLGKLSNQGEGSSLHVHDKLEQKQRNFAVSKVLHDMN